MSQDGMMKSNPKLDHAVNSSETFEDMRERLKAALAGDGIIARERGHEYGAQVLQQPSATAASDLALPDGRFERIVYVSNERIVLTGNSAELDRLESVLRGQR
jgi:hypothetical protein